MDFEELRDELIKLKKEVVETMRRESSDVFKNKMNDFIVDIIESFSDRDKLIENGAIGKSDDIDLVDNILEELQNIKDECFDYSETRPKKKSPWIDIRNTPLRPDEDTKVLVKNVDEDERCSYPMIAMYDEEYEGFEAVGRVGEGRINCLNITHFMFIPGLKDD